MPGLPFAATLLVACVVVEVSAAGLHRTRRLLRSERVDERSAVDAMLPSQEVRDGADQRPLRSRGRGRALDTSGKQSNPI